LFHKALEKLGNSRKRSQGAQKPIPTADVRRLFSEDPKGHKGKPLVTSHFLPLYLRKSASICGSSFFCCLSRRSFA
jgi:hypothetical protein